MKKITLSIIIILLSTAAFCEGWPIGKDWYYENDTTLTGDGGSKYYQALIRGNVADSFKEQDGYCIINGEQHHYYLYNSYYYHSGDDSAFYTHYLPNWIESNGFIYDFEKTEKKVITPPPALVALMQQRNCDLAIQEAFSNSAGNQWVEVISYSKKRNDYTLTRYWLQKRK